MWFESSELKAASQALAFTSADGRAALQKAADLSPLAVLSAATSLAISASVNLPRSASAPRKCQRRSASTTKPATSPSRICRIRAFWRSENAAVTNERAYCNCISEPGALFSSKISKPFAICSRTLSRFSAHANNSTAVPI